jgi:Ca2+-binding RTX toxin-like protein
MVQSVTIHGSHNESVILGFGSTSNFLLAQQLASYLNTQIADHKLVTESDQGGTFPILPWGISGAYVQTTTQTAILPTGYTTDLITKPGDAVVFGSGAPNEAIMSDADTDLTFTASSGSGTVVAGGGNSRIMLSADAPHAMGWADDDKGAWGDKGDKGHHGDKDHKHDTSTSPVSNWLVYTGSGNDYISLIGDVNATIGAGGGQNTILLGSGHDLIISTSTDTIIGGSGAATIDATSAKSDLVAGGSGSLYFLGGAGGATIVGGSGSDTYYGSTGTKVGSQLVEGGSGGNNYLQAGNGLATLIGGGNGDQLSAFGASAQWLKAGAGNETLSAAQSSGADTLTAGSGKDSLIGSILGSDTFVGGSGAATVQAGFGSNVFEFMKGQGGTELVTGIIDPSSIQIALVGYASNEVTKALASQTVSHGSVSISLTDGTKITFQDVTSLTKSNFT